MEKTTTDSKGCVVPTEEFQEHVQDLLEGVDKPWRNDGIVAHVYLESDLNTPEAAKLLGTSTCVLASQTKSIRLRNEYRGVDTSTEYENPLDDLELLQRLRREGLGAREIAAVLWTAGPGSVGRSSSTRPGSIRENTVSLHLLRVQARGCRTGTTGTRRARSRPRTQGLQA